MLKKITPILLLFVFLAGCGSFDQLNNVDIGLFVGDREGQTADNHSSAKQDEQMNIIQQMGLEIGSVPPAVALDTLNGEAFDQELLKDKKVILNFWASWCDPCRQEMPDIIRLARENPDDLVVLAINLKEDQERVEAFVEELGMQDLHVLLDQKEELAKQFQIIAVPTTYFLNSEGKIAQKHIGYMNYAQFVETLNNIN